MAWIEKTTDGYRIGWRQGGRDAPKQYRAAPDKRTADALRRRIEQDLSLHGRVTIDDKEEAPPALCTRLDAWLDAMQISLGHRTIAGYSDSCVLLLRFLADQQKRSADELPVTSLRRETLIAFQAWLLQDGRANSTVAKRAQAIRLAWEWLYEGEDRRWLEAPPRKIATRKAPPARPIAPTWAEADACLEACFEHDPRAPWLYYFAVVARFTGLRRSEILLMKWEHVSLDGAFVLLQSETTKGGYSGRKIPLSPHLVKELLLLPNNGDWVVPAPEGERVAASGDGRGHVDRNMRRAWTRANVRNEVWQGQPCHAFRKTIQTELELARVRREVTEYLVGHQPTGTGGRYYLDAERGLWPELVEAVGKIPPLPDRERTGIVVPLKKRA